MNILRNIEKIEAALRFLESFDLPVVAIRSEFHTRLLVESEGQPRVDDLAYELPVGHREWEARIAEDSPLLSCSVAYEGWQYELTPGQRDWIRSHYNMTPARTVTLTQLAHWKGTRHPKEFLLTSGEHVNPALRRNCLVMARITTPGTFFRESLALDKAREEQRSEATQHDMSTTRSTKINLDVDAMMAELEKSLS